MFIPPLEIQSLTCIYLKVHKRFFLITRRKMQRRHCKLRSRACVKTISASWRSPTARQPSSRSSQSGSSTQSTWTEAHSRRLPDRGSYDHYSTWPDIFVVQYCTNTIVLQRAFKKLTTWPVSLGVYKPVPNGLTCQPFQPCESVVWSP